MNNQTRRQALYFPADMLGELQNEATRQDRSISWLIQQAWRIARKEMRRIPSTTDYLPPDYLEISDEETAAGAPNAVDPAAAAHLLARDG